MINFDEPLPLSLSQSLSPSSSHPYTAGETNINYYKPQHRGLQCPLIIIAKQEVKKEVQRSF